MTSEKDLYTYNRKQVIWLYKICQILLFLYLNKFLQERIDGLLQSSISKKCGFPSVIGKKGSHPDSQALTTFHYHDIFPSPCTVLPSQLSATWLLWPHKLYIAWFNGRGSLAWERAWQKLQRGGAGWPCEPWSLGPEEGSF